jgi:AraC-like DNA-binding protein
MGRLRELRLTYPLHPSVLVTSQAPANARQLLGLPADGVVWMEAVRDEFWPAVCAARASSLLNRAAQSVEESPALSPLLRDMIAHALRSVPPPSSVQQLAELSGCHRSTLAKHWMVAAPGAGAPRLQDFADWLVLLHAAGRKPRHLKWSAVAHECAVHEETLRRICSRLTGLRLGQIEGADGRSIVIHAFRDRCLQPLGIAPRDLAAAS